MATGASTPDRYLDAAIRTGRWLVARAIDTPEGPGWPQVVRSEPEPISTTLYGGAGVVMYLAELATATGDRDFTDVARAGARLVARSPDPGLYGLYSGYAGSAMAVAHVGEELGDQELSVQAEAMIDHLLEVARPAGAGIEWPAWPNGRGPWWELYNGNAGIALVLLSRGRLEAAQAAGARLVELAQFARQGRWWRSRPDDHKPAPNIAHGTAGVAHSLASLALATGETSFTEAAVDGARYLLSIARVTNGTCAVHHHEVDGTQLYTMGFCSGPPGLACLFIRLHQLTGDASWLEWSARAARTVMSSGLPVRLYPGFWDNVAQCCGSAGVADFFLGMYTLTGEEAYLAFAEVVLDDVLDRAVVDARGMCWHNVEPTVRPSVLPAQTGWMQGAAGVGAALLRAHRVLTGGAAGPWLPSWPFGLR